MHTMQNLKSIEDCAFCIFPNLETLIIAASPNLEKIHENAFGVVDGTNVPKLRWFLALSCKLSTLSENLLNWDTVESIEIAENPFICDCSMTWLINDFAYSNPKYINKLGASDFYPGHHIIKKEELECSDPPELKGKTFKEISNKLCNTSFTETTVFDSTFQKETKHELNYVGIICVIFAFILVMALWCYFSCGKNHASSNAQVSTPEEAERLNEEISLNEL